MSARSEHEYEPIASPSMLLQGSLMKPHSALSGSAPVVRINDTDVVHVADSDESIDVQERRFNPKQLVLDGDVVVPLDGEIEDSAMQAKELGDTAGDTSEEQETAQQLQDRLEERFLYSTTPCTESRTDAEINTSQVDSSALEELPLRRGARGFNDRLRSQAGKLRSRLRGIQRPSFSLPERQKTEKTKTTKVEKSKSVKSAKPAKTEKSRFSLPERSKFNFPERPKFNFPERPKFNLPERPKFNIKKPNINLPTLGRVRKPLKERQNSSESATSGSKRNIFDFSTYPRIFDKKSKSRGEYATSSPKSSRAQSPESATVPRVKKKAPIGARWVQRFSDIKYADDEPDNAVERSKPWRRPSTEEPQVAFRPEAAESRERLPWEESDDRSMEESRERGEDKPEPIAKREEEEEVEYIDEDSVELEDRRIVVALPIGTGFAEGLDDVVPDHRLYPRGLEESSYESRARETKRKWLEEPIDADHEIEEEVPHPDSYGHEDYSGEMIPEDGYGGSFMPIDPPRNLYMPREATPEEASLRSDREQQSSGSSCDRRRRGVLEEIDSDEFFLRAKGISQDDMAMGRFLASEIRDAFRPSGNALADHDRDLDPAIPPTRPVRTRSMRKRREENPPESYDATPPARPKRDRRRSEDSLQQFDDYERFLNREKTGSISSSRHRVIYQTEGTPRPVEPLDDIVVVKPARRKSRSVARSYSEFDSEVIKPPLPPTPPVAPRRRKRGRRQPDTHGPVPVANGHRTNGEMYNGHRQDIQDWQETNNFTPEPHEAPEILQEDKLETLVNRLDHEYIEPAPMAPKRRSRSRGTSVADDDRTSRGAESLPEVGYLEEDDEGVAPRDTDSRDLPGYAVVDKKEKPPRPPPPRRRRDKFATTPKPKTTSTPEIPVRPRRAYSTLGPSRRRSTSEDRDQNPLDVTPYTELDSDDPDSRDLRSGPIVNKIQGRPLPAPPRPPRARRDPSEPENGVVEIAASTQTDPLPDDLVIEEEVTRAKLVMAPSRSGSQILVSTERIASPTFGRSSPAVPPLPDPVDRERLRPSQTPDSGEFGGEEEFEKEEAVTEDRPQTPVTPASSLTLPHEDRIRIASLEVADLRVERLNVNQLEAHKISASEVDAIVVSASEISGASNTAESVIHPELLKELIAIRSQLEQVQAQVNAGEKKVKEETRSEVQQLIDSLKESDKDKQETDFIEESERIEDQEMKELEKELEKSAEEKKSVEIVTVESPKPELDTQPIEEVRETQEPQKLEEIDSTPQVPQESTPDLPPSPDLESPQETTEAQMPTSLSTPAKEEATSEVQEDKRKWSRSRSTSPSRDGKLFVRQTASPVKSLPPLISVTPDTPDPVPSPVPEAQVQPQRAIVSYAETEEETVQRQPNAGLTQYVAFPTSQIPPSFFALASPAPTSVDTEPSIPEMTQQLLRAIRLAGTRAMRHFVGYVVSRVNVEDRGEKTKEIELAICALLLLIAGLLILCFGSPRTVTHHHHWDYFNPPQ